MIALCKYFVLVSIYIFVKYIFDMAHFSKYGFYNKGEYKYLIQWIMGTAQS